MQVERSIDVPFAIPALRWPNLKRPVQRLRVLWPAAVVDQIAKDEAGRKEREKVAAEKARQASRSITGSPSAAVRETGNGSRGSSHDDARAAYNEIMARV
jgi:hypothetical protein